MNKEYMMYVDNWRTNEDNIKELRTGKFPEYCEKVKM